MIRSMTAFSRQEAQSDIGALTWELRSVNHRYLECALRLPEELRGLEVTLRERAAAALGRGKLEGTLRFQPNENDDTALVINQPLAGAVARACRDLQPLVDGAMPPGALELLRWPGVVQKAETDLQPVQAAALALYDATLADLVAMREREGGRLKEMILERCTGLVGLSAKARTRRPEVMVRQREKLTARLAEISAGADPARLEQELVIQAQKLDVAEELDRLDSHITEMQHILTRNEPVGRRMDFLMQEFNREANTLGSKSADTETTRISVDMKVLIEQMREQIQNIE